MIGSEQVQEIIRQYGKHGWNLRRVLLSAPTREILPVALFAPAAVGAAEFDALWFSRAAANGGETWELRSLSATPFALVEVFDSEDDEETREVMRSEMETKITEKASKPLAGKREV